MGEPCRQSSGGVAFLVMPADLLAEETTKEPRSKAVRETLSSNSETQSLNGGKNYHGEAAEQILKILQAFKVQS